MSRVQEQQQFREVEGLWHRSGLSCNSDNETFPLQQCQSPLRVNCFWCHCHGTWFCPCLSLTCGQQWLGCFPHPYNWIKERTACLCPSSELWLIWLITIYIDYISNRVCVTCHIQVPLLHHLIICFLCLQNQKCRSLSCPRGCRQTSQPWIWLWLNAAMNTEEIQLCSLSEAINTVYHKKIIVTGGNKEFGKTLRPCRMLLFHGQSPPRTSSPKTKLQTALAPSRIYVRITSVDLNIALQASLSSVQLHPWLACWIKFTAVTA